MWTNICLLFGEEEKNIVISSSPIKDGPTNQPTNRWKYQNIQSLNTCLAITIHMLTLYHKNIAANMDDIDDNDRTMTWANFFSLRPTNIHTLPMTTTTMTLWHRSHRKESVHNEQKQQVAKTKSRTGTFKCLSFSLSFPSYDKLCETKYNLALIRSVFANVMK